MHYLLVTEKHGAGRMMLGAGGRGRRSTINALPYARLPPAINPVAFAPYAAALPSAINPAFAPYAAACPHRCGTRPLTPHAHQPHLQNPLSHPQRCRRSTLPP